MMNRKTIILLLALLSAGAFSFAQESKKSSLQQKAETEEAAGKTASARSLYMKAFDDYAGHGQMQQGVPCGVKAAMYLYTDGNYKEAFEWLRGIDQAIMADKKLTDAGKSALRYQTSRERMKMYMRMHRSASAGEQLGIMEGHARAAADDDVTADLLYNKTIYSYSVGKTAQGNALFKEMSEKMMAGKAYDKVEDAYQAVIKAGRNSGSASMVDQAYKNYIAWKDSASAMKHADEVALLKGQIDEGKAAIAERDSKLSSRQTFIVTLLVALAVLCGVLLMGSMVLLRYIRLTHKQKKTIRQADENNALKAKFISNMSAQLAPTLQQLDSHVPAVKALQDFSGHIQMLSDIDLSAGKKLELEDVQIQPLCEELVESVRSKAKPGVNLTADVSKTSVPLYVPYVRHILEHLLGNAAVFTPEGGHISLSFKKRSPHKFQFLVQNTGEAIPEEKREDIFKPFLEVRDLTQGDGLGLPICRQMATRMGGSLEVDPDFTRGVRFVLNLEA